MIRPRREEVAALVAILESDEHGSAEGMAEALLKRTYELFLHRDWWLWLNQDQAPSLVYGPFSQQREAEKLAQRAGLGGRNYTLKLLSPAAMEARITEHDAKAGEAVCSCGHIKGQHEHPKTQGRCMSGSINRAKRFVSDCSCRSFEEAS